MRWIKTFLLLLAFFVAIVFAIQNQSEINLRFIFPGENHRWFGMQERSFPVFLVVFCSVFIGFLIGWAGDLSKHLQVKKTLRQHRKTIEKLEKEIQSIRGNEYIQPAISRKEG